MSNPESQPKRGFGERRLRSLRNLHLGVGALALAGLALIPPTAAITAPLAIYGGFGAGALHKAAKSRRKESHK